MTLSLPLLYSLINGSTRVLNSIAPSTFNMTLFVGHSCIFKILYYQEKFKIENQSVFQRTTVISVNLSQNKIYDFNFTRVIRLNHTMH